MVYTFDRIGWNGFAQYFAKDPDTHPRAHHISRKLYVQMGQPEEIMVVIVPVIAGKEFPDASTKPSSA
jgi:hypothetical protein